MNGHPAGTSRCMLEQEKDMGCADFLLFYAWNKSAGWFSSMNRRRSRVA